VSALERRKAGRRYVVRFAVAMASYVVLLFVGIAIARTLGDSPWRFAAMALPVPAMVGVVWAVARYASEADELQSRDLTRALAIGFGGGSLLTFTYGIMQTVGAPPLNWMFVWVIYTGCWAIGSVIVRRRG
jgi:O-antigen/teichoic acid export membrane protein